MTEILDDLVDYWSIHSKKGEQPVRRAFAQGKEQAEALLASIRDTDGNSEDTYWLVQMTATELDTMQAMGEISQDT